MRNVSVSVIAASWSCCKILCLYYRWRSPFSPGAPRACGITAVRLAKSDFKFHTVELYCFFGPSPFPSRIRWSPLWNLKAEAVRATNGKHYHKHDDALCVMFSEMHRTLLGMPFRSKRRMKYEESLDKARGAKVLKVSSRLGL